MIRQSFGDLVQCRSNAVRIHEHQHAWPRPTPRWRERMHRAKAILRANLVCFMRHVRLLFSLADQTWRASNARRYLVAVRLPRFVFIAAMLASVRTECDAQRLESLWYLRGEQSIQAFIK